MSSRPTYDPLEKTLDAMDLPLYARMELICIMDVYLVIEQLIHGWPVTVPTEDAFELLSTTAKGRNTFARNI